MAIVTNKKKGEEDADNKSSMQMIEYFHLIIVWLFFCCQGDVLLDPDYLQQLQRRINEIDQRTIGLIVLGGVERLTM